LECCVDKLAKGNRAKKSKKGRWGRATGRGRFGASLTLICGYSGSKGSSGRKINS